MELKIFCKIKKVKVYIKLTKRNSVKDKSKTECELWIVLIHDTKNGLYMKFYKY